jgi:hypothetical protein
MHYLILMGFSLGAFVGLFNFCRDLTRIKKSPHLPELDQKNCGDIAYNTLLVDPKMVVSTARGLGNILENLGHFLHIS